MVFTLDANNETLGEEGYQMDIAGQVLIKANTTKGSFYAMQSLLQLFEQDIKIQRGFMLEPGRTYKVQAGCIDGTCFIFIDGEEIIELSDPDPIDNTKYGKIEFTAWSSHIQIRNIVIRDISWRSVEMSYSPEL